MNNRGVIRAQVPSLTVWALVAFASAPLGDLAAGSREANVPRAIPISLRESLLPSAIRDARAGKVLIEGSLEKQQDVLVRLRVTSSLGYQGVLRVRASLGKFDCSYPGDFSGAPRLEPCLLFVDAKRLPRG